MKKLTAGIFASLLSVVGISAANAEIASKAYVDQGVGGVVTRVTTVEGDITNIKNVTDNLDTTISGAIDAATGEDGAIADAIAAAVADKATTAALNAVDVKVEKNKTDIATLNGTGEGSVSKAVSDAIATEVTRADGAYAVKGTETVASDAKTAATANTAAITTLNANAETEGSVDYKIAQSKTAIDTAVNAAKDAADAAQETANANKAAIENETTGLAATKAIADKNKTDIAAINAAGTGILDTAKGYTDTKVGEVNTKLNDYATTEYVDTEVGKKVATETYNTQIGTVTSANMGASEAATTVVAGIKEANDATKTNAQQIAANKTAIDSSLDELGTDVESRLPRPTAACADAKNKCVLVSAGKGNYTWEVIERGTTETTGTAE